MRHYRIEEESPNDSENQSKVTFRQALAKTLQNTLKLLPFAEFSVNYGYAIENVWITMVMIVHKTPGWLDSFVWIAPIVIAVLTRPYLVRFIHQINLKVYREITLTCLALLIGAAGCFVTGLSCDIQKREKGVFPSQTFLRIAVCSVGWTLMDVGFEFALYFANKIKEGYEQLLEEKAEEGKEGTEGKEGKAEHEGLFTEANFAFYGLVVGYVVSILICWIIHGRSVKAFYRCAKYAYYSVGILAAITALRLYIEGKLNLPHRSDEPRSEALSPSPVFTIERKVDFYLPGFTELLGSNPRTFSLLLVHASVVFLNDVVLIYTTMWFSDVAGMQHETVGAGYIYGLEVGALTLLGYTVVDNLHVKSVLFTNPYLLQLALLLAAAASLLANLTYGHVGFLLLALSVAVLNHFYRRAVLARESESNPLFERCMETTERIEKIVVLSLFPGVVLLLLKRDDIPDSLVANIGMAIVAIVALLVSQLRVGLKENAAAGVKVDKIE